MVDFYASWCGHCQRFAPVYESLAETLQDRESPTRLFKIDAFKYPSIRAHWEIHGFPTLEYFYNGEMIERFSGKRSLKALNNFIKKQEKKFGLIS
jgi:protein disulfide-isomerase-like protein